MATYRSLPDAQRGVFYEYTSYAFSPESGPSTYDPDEHDTARANLGSRRGLYADDASVDADPLCVCRHHWLAVDDPLVAWNDGTFALDVSNGVGSCEPIAGDPDARIDVGALSQLAVGYRSATELARTNRLRVDTAERAASFDRLFPSTVTYLGDRF